MCIFEVQLSRVQSTHWGAWDNGFDVCNRNVVVFVVVLSVCFDYVSDMWGSGVVA